MKTAFTFSFVLVVAAAMSQAKSELPRTEFTISLSEHTLSIKPGETRQVTVLIARSKSFAKGKVVLGSSSILPQGIALSYEPASGNFESSIATITVDTAAAPGSYQVVLNGTVYYKTKGTILKLLVSNENVAVK